MVWPHWNPFYWRGSLHQLKFNMESERDDVGIQFFTFQASKFQGRSHPQSPNPQTAPPEPRLVPDVSLATSSGVEK